MCAKQLSQGLKTFQVQFLSTTPQETLPKKSPQNTPSVPLKKILTIPTSKSFPDMYSP